MTITTHILRYFSTLGTLLISVICCISTGCNKQTFPHNQQISTAESLIWTNPDSALHILQTIRPESLSRDDRYFWYYIHEHASSRIGAPVSPDSIMPQVIDFFHKKRAYSYLAKSYYVQGTEYFQTSDYDNAIASLKNAEERLEFITDTITYAAMTYYLEGFIAETDLLDGVACSYYQKALQLFIQTGDKRRMACCYRDLADMDNDVESMDDYYEKAVAIASEIKDTILLYDILIQKELTEPLGDTLRIIELSHFLMDRYGNNHYANVIAEYMIDHDRLEEADFYLQKYEDNHGMVWGVDWSTFLRGLYQAKRGNVQQAYQQLKNTYHTLYDDLFEKAGSRTFIISRAYDVELERNKNLQLKVDKQRLIISLGIICSISIVALLIAGLLYSMERNRRMIQKQENEIAKLRAEEAENNLKLTKVELQEKRNALKRLLKQRMQLTEHIVQSVDGMDNMTKGLQKKVGELTFLEKKNLTDFMTELNSLYGNVLDRIKKDYPSITEQDLEYLSLAILGMDSSEIAILLQINTQSVYNRRQRIRNHLGDNHLDLDSWIKELQHG